MLDVKEVKCPYCSDTAFVYKTEVEMFLCHGCQRDLNYEKVKEYDANKSVDTGSRNTRIDIRQNVDYSSVLRYCERLDTLPDSHKCVRYVRSRGIDSSLLVDLYYSERFREIGISTGNIMVKGDESPRLVIPIRNSEGKIYGMQGRALDDNEMRYLTMYFNNNERIYGLDKVDVTKPFNVVEGPIDSFFIKNCVALCGANDIDNKYSKLATIILDNEPRNRQIVDKVAKYLDRQFKVVIWPDHIKEKDINEMTLAGIDVNAVVTSNTFSGLTGKLQLNAWKKTQ